MSPISQVAQEFIAAAVRVARLEDAIWRVLAHQRRRSNTQEAPTEREHKAYAQVCELHLELTGEKPDLNSAMGTAIAERDRGYARIVELAANLARLMQQAGNRKGAAAFCKLQTAMTHNLDGRLAPSQPVMNRKLMLEVQEVLAAYGVDGIPLDCAVIAALVDCEEASHENGTIDSSSAEPARSGAGPLGDVGAEEPEQANTDAPLSERQRYILSAMLILKAFASDSRQNTTDIAAQAEGRGANPEGFKEAVADLRRKRLLATKEGRGGGCWLTDVGRQRAEQLSKL